MTGIALTWGTPATSLSAVLDGLAHRGRFRTERTQRPFALGAVGADERDAGVARRGERWVVADARLADREALVRRVGVETTAPTADLIAAAFERCGPDVVHHLRGDYAFVVVDPRRRRVFAARDPLGARPFYFRAGPKVLVCASEPGALLRDPDCPRRPHLVQVGLFLGGLHNEADETLFEGIHALQGGFSLRWDEGQDVRRRRFWMPDPWRQRRVSLEEGAELVGEVARRALARRVPDGRVAVFLSGGLDSAAVAGALASRRRSSGASPPLLVHARLRGDDDETEYSRAVANAWALDCVETDPQEDPPRSLPVPGRRADLFWEPRQGMWAQMYEAARARGVDVGLNGDGVEDCLGPSGMEWADDFLQGRWRRPLVQSGVATRPWSIRAWGRLVRTSLGRWWPSSRAEEDPAGLTRGYADIAAQVAHDRRHRRDARAYPSLAARAIGAIYEEGDAGFGAAFAERSAAHHGFANVAALQDVELVELLLSLPMSLRDTPGQDKAKPVFRRAFFDVVPPTIRRRSRSGTYLGLYDTVLREHGALRAAFRGPRRLVEAGVLREAYGRAYAAGGLGPSHGRSHVDQLVSASMCAMMESFLKEM
ncbi:MAG: asparagine synthase-related protein [Myxococcota bacterium]